ncbi:hypothetical protein L227DRAFT_37977 [Lentinus tigrinus ALCF2SS1-6]|uniref:Uncharacterized protein n=1 Tax=Lentinus tigrinus ALCF2SS1-6 TaxID=1328759 RepID=A0A5C2SGV1_9APHY|nr:hypothetical protein L227DRAFT_37977 [Lentinus tigrinus ALCF2SS1-6]
MQAAPTYIRDDIYRQTANMMQMPHCRWIASLTSRTADIEAQSRGTTQHYALDSIVSLLPRPQPFSAPRLAGATGLSRLENSSVRSEPPCRLYAIGRRAVSYDYAQSHGPNGLSPMDTALTHRVLQGVPRKKTSSAVGRSSDFSLRDLSGGRSPGVVHVVLARIVCLCRHEIIGGDVVSIYLILFARQASSSMNCLQTSSPTGYPDASRTLPVPVSHLQKSCNRSTRTSNSTVVIAWDESSDLLAFSKRCRRRPWAQVIRIARSKFTCTGTSVRCCAAAGSPASGPWPLRGAADS